MEESYMAIMHMNILKKLQNIYEYLLCILYYLSFTTFSTLLFTT